MRLNRLTWCGIVVAVSWVLLMGHAFVAYQQWGIDRRLLQNPCGPPPPYPNRLLSGDAFPFMTYDSTNEIVDFYYQSDPRHIRSTYDGHSRDWNELVFVFELPKENPSELEIRFNVACVNMYLIIYEYGLFRITMLYYITPNGVDITR